jgi:hypothetical protein
MQYHGGSFAILDLFSNFPPDLFAIQYIGQDIANNTSAERQHHLPGY